MKRLFEVMLIALMVVGMTVDIGAFDDPEYAQEIKMIQEAGGEIYEIDGEDVSFKLGTKLVTCKWFYVDNYFKNGEND